MSQVLLLQLDGTMPNLALMRLSAHHKARGDSVELRQCRTRESVERLLWDDFDEVYASLIFERSLPVAKRVREIYPAAKIGGTGWDTQTTLEQFGVMGQQCDYSLYPGYRHSIGFTQRGCRLRCSFCKVPAKEGAVKRAGRVADIWRGEPWPKNLLLLDNDFFGEPSWREQVEDIHAGGFRVCLNQGFNVRLIDDEQAKVIAGLPYYDDQFKVRRLYTAWDNRRDEDRLFRNLEILVKHGVKPDQIVVYMLVGYWDGPQLNEGDLYRHRRLREFGCRPYPMPFVKTRELSGFQRWIVRRSDLMVSWERFKAANYRPELVGANDPDS